jgi:hypothetical protein
VSRLPIKQPTQQEATYLKRQERALEQWELVGNQKREGKEANLLIESCLSLVHGILKRDKESLDHLVHLELVKMFSKDIKNIEAKTLLNSE